MNGRVQGGAGPRIARVIAQVIITAAALLASTAWSAAYAQDHVARSNDPQTQSAVADYNAGNLAAALTEFREAAERGSRLAQFNYAMMLLNGEGTPVNVDEGKKWLRKAADANMSHAQYVYGKMYDDGEFVERDPVEAHRWFMKAAAQGHVQAELALANQFLDGRGTERDNKQAFVWYKKAAQGGDMTAQYVTGSFYERGGDGVDRNLNVARAYYAAAAAQGDPAARLKYQQLSAQLRDQKEVKPQ
ncbi:tetratricopeptide repeat protein [Paraburkholderia sp. BR13439]|uniref:Sel1 repeat family protein n=1 Tax=Paraburkholderia youngii TaxID=2782701 RepID=A0A7Y6N007_9BURK|nr:tetratricopeptide repeat protein [Paraburkholderia youngii]NUY03633.1 sel1 repeat family protein [Paraburkholderia youngii]NVI05523.1 sel1 repeat family protein [Paraburkholderia youngii]